MTDFGVGSAPKGGAVNGFPKVGTGVGTPPNTGTMALGRGIGAGLDASMEGAALADGLEANEDETGLSIARNDFNNSPKF